LHKIVQNPEHIAINAESSNTESDESFSKENKSNSQSNEKNAATKENNFVSQVKSESRFNLSIGLVLFRINLMQTFSRFDSI
jgi:hypothetical protein